MYIIYTYIYNMGIKFNETKKKLINNLNLFYFSLKKHLYLFYNNTFFLYKIY